MNGNELEKIITVSLELAYFKVSGIALIVDWYSQNNLIDMHTFTIEPNECDNLAELDEQIIERINDGRFGSQKILGAICEITAVYTNNYSGDSLARSFKTQIYNKDKILTDEERDILTDALFK